MKHPTISSNESKKDLPVGEDFIHDTHVHLENLTLDSSLPTSRSDQDVMSSTTNNSNTSTMATSFSNTNASESANDQVTSITISANGTNETWELTWPIWHMLPRSERKAIANEHGFATIGHFEESVILSRALQENDIPVAESGIDGVARMPYEPYDSNEMQDLEHRPERYGLPMVMEKSSIADKQGKENDDEDEESSSSSQEIEMDRQLLQHACIPSATTKHGIETLDLEDRIEQGGYLLLLPDELILHSVLPYLDLDHYVTLALVSPLYASFTRTEAVYKQLCQRNYLNQSKRKILQVQKFGGSYRAMLERRYRVKMGCGLYVLKCSKVRKIQRDMWTEVRGYNMYCTSL
jgi:F-box protein 9